MTYNGLTGDQKFLVGSAIITLGAWVMGGRRLGAVTGSLLFGAYTIEKFRQRADMQIVQSEERLRSYMNTGARSL